MTSHWTHLLKISPGSPSLYHRGFEGTFKIQIMPTIIPDIKQVFNDFALHPLFPFLLMKNSGNKKIQKIDWGAQVRR
jgi:hypothetical protein